MKLDLIVAVITTEDGGYYATCPAITEAFGEGKTKATALAALKEDLETRIAEHGFERYKPNDVSIEKISINYF